VHNTKTIVVLPSCTTQTAKHVYKTC